jgi:chemotaxis protein histidine kinase CheA
MLAQAQEEANRTLALAREKGEQIIDQDAVVQAAKERSDQILAQAEKDVESIKRDADVYALQTLADLEMELERVLGQVRNGVRTLQDELNRPPAE